MKNNNNDILLTYSVYGGVGIQLAVSVAGGALLGIWIDQKWDFSPWFMVTGVILGSVSGFYNLIRIMSWHTERKSK